ncbi:FecR family protein [Paraflavitalea soli]|uniref:FecR family protein n=1 Tax=Paraflavitalea soli TaxID=2315862 RepID=A0A3B7MKT7_9BACT|nr:FecR family protein [Paraflavitalea soli]AXY74788.1 FecR family protein [Paraflavitalea soli]
MNAHHHPSISELISKYLAGEANAAEAMLLDDWLAAPENAREFKRIAALWNQLPGTAIPQPPAPQQAWAELEPLLTANRPAAIIRRLRNHYAAAAVIGLLILAAVYWFTRTKEHPNSGANQITKATTNALRTDTMPDGSTITINKNSEVVYTAGFNKSDRQVAMKGECYFNVVPDKSKPFVISVYDLTIKVVGTSFNVRDVTPSGNIEVQVQSGVVKMYTPQKEITVNKGQTGIYNKQRQALYVRDSLDINSIGYATRTFSFNDMAVIDACRYLEKAFNVTINLDTQQFNGCRLSAQFDNKSLPYILNIINATLNTTYRQQGNTIFISGNGCH